MEERVPPADRRDDPLLESPSFKKYPLPRPPPPRQTNSNTTVGSNNPHRLTKSYDSPSFTFPHMSPNHQESESDNILNNATSSLFNANTPAPLVTALPFPPGRESPETYVVQIPKEQILWVPPPENARILESFRKTRDKKCPGNYCLWILLALIIIGAIVGIAIGVIHLLYNPKSPHFSITNIQVINPPPSKQKHAKPEFDITLLVENPNQRMGIEYEKGGKSSLSFKDHVIGKSDFPSSSQEPKNSMNAKVQLFGSNTELPQEIQKSLNETKPKKELSFGFTAKVAIKFTSWMQPTKKNLDVTCDFKVNTLGKGSKIVEQTCES